MVSALTVEAVGEIFTSTQLLVVEGVEDFLFLLKHIPGMCVNAVVRYVLFRDFTITIRMTCFKCFFKTGPGLNNIAS